jgi:short-subunit dehydrogenase
MPSLIERKGSIVGISSIAGYRGLPGRSAYSASKFALQGWLEALRIELIDDGVNVMWVCPGFVTSNIRNVALDHDGLPQKVNPMDESKMMSPEECAHYITEAIEKRKRSLILTFTGKRTVFLNKFFPSLTDKLVHKFYFDKGELKK